MSDDAKEEKKPLPKPVNYDDLYPGRFIKAGSMKGRDVTLTIDHVELEILPGEKGESVKAIIHFKENTKLGQPIQHVPSKTNGECLKAMFGKNLADWTGKRVTLYPTTTKLGKLTVDAIRVRGSPDINETITFELRLPKKKAQLISLQKTGAKAPVAAEAKPAAAPDATPPTAVGALAEAAPANPDAPF